MTAAETVRAMVVLLLNVPEAPVMVTVAVPVVAEPLAVRVSTLLPLVGLVAKDEVTPLGKPEATRVTLPLKPLAGITVMVLVPLLLWLILKLLGEPLKVKLAAGLAVMVRVSEVLEVRPPELPVIVTDAVPIVAVLDAVRVRTLDVAVGLLENDAVTPLGRFEAAKVTLPVKPLAGVTLTVLVPLAPWEMVKLPG